MDRKDYYDVKGIMFSCELILNLFIVIDLKMNMDPYIYFKV